ncbi:phosphatidylinositol-specific phospholipase C domain-containing protein [Shewanella surugensis]|uniref:Phosphatidylinositol-specific phospholipase C domain-containing protein n=1 Tax=Shewanella surugensis TaxID=212020 RepID=A0ABT0LHA1_9GAMM|nr:phosphatidylinositol-specific phospholipase C domain-containing protein [Shewanella surugensis]MCL1127068.1 phosphatidylinositol-specific phospholipase C domain-containing protein [Shewanella surugensis]
MKKINKILNLVLIIGLSLSSTAQAGWWNKTKKWVDKEIVEPVVDIGESTAEGATESWNDVSSWTQSGWESSVDWSEEAWEASEDFYTYIVDEAGDKITFGASQIPLLGAIIENAYEATFNNHRYGLDLNQWEVKALKLQNHLDYQEPLSNSFIFGSHNSFNAKEYATAMRYLDPNHKLSIYDQLDAGVRGIVLDVHKFDKADSFWIWEWDSELLLCHGQSNHSGCSAYDRALIEGLAEIKSWLDENPNELIVVTVEDQMENKHTQAAELFSGVLGDYIYRPTSGGCQELPWNMTKQDILDTGKQVLVQARFTCDSNNADWQAIVFEFDRKKGDVIDARNGECPSFNQGSQWLLYAEDRAVATNEPDEELLHSDDLQQLMACGVNLIGLDMIGYASTNRIEGAIWSWDDNEPNDYRNNEDCAESWENGRINDVNCSNSKKVACKNEAGEWLITQEQVNWSEASALCEAEVNGEYVFSVPANYIDNQSLIAAKELMRVTRVWLNYTDQLMEGYWTSHGLTDTNIALQGIASQSSTGYSGSADRANDGDTDGIYGHHSVTHTANRTDDWWQIDLKANAYLETIALFNRTDGCCTERLQNFYIMISDTAFSSNELDEALAQSSWNHYYTGVMPVSAEINIEKEGRYLRIQQTSSNYLSLAEVKIMGLYQ